VNRSAEIPAVEKLPATASESHPGRAIVGYLAVSLVPLLLLANTTVALARGWIIESRLDRAALIALVVWLTIATGLVLLPAGRRFYAQRFPQLILAGASLLLAWAVAELLLGPALAQLAEPLHGRRPGLEFVYRPAAGIMRDVGVEAHVKFNSWGVRGGEPPARSTAYRILCLGGSSTACTYLDDTKTWPARLEQDLNAAESKRGYWVGNAGLPGYRSDGHRQFLEESPLVDEIDCVLVQVGINDFMACLAGPPPAPPWWTRSRIWRMAGTLARRFADAGTLVEDTAGSVYVRRRAIRQAAELDPQPPEIAACLDEFKTNLERIVDICHERKVRLIFTTQPVLWRNDLDAENDSLLWFGQLRDGRFLSVEQLRRGMDRYNDSLRAVCRQRHVELIDLAPLDGDASVFYDDCHFTETGAARVAALVAQWFAAHPLRSDSPESPESKGSRP
jgi:lysophospholipase L1-like esterase